MQKIFLLLFLSIGVHAQKSNFDSLNIESEVGTLIASGKTPFLLRSKQYGTVPLEGNFLYINSKISKPYHPKRKFDYGFGIEPHVIIGKSSTFLLPEAYLKAKAGHLEIYAGRVREVVGLVDTLGTMGSYIWSGNALPVPKIDIGIRSFTPLTKNGLLSIKGNFAHGWLGSGDSVQNVFLHQKSLYVRIGKPKWNIKIITGFNHQAQWGGKPTRPYMDAISGQMITKYDVSFENYLRVLTGISIGNQTGQAWDEIEGVPANEAGNRVGNHLGTIDLGAELKIGENLLKIYRQSIFEDGSLFYLNNITDGLTGLSLSSPQGFNICLEYLDTRSQGGPIYYGNIPELRGRDNYFNNTVYRDSWTYKGKTIGNPLLNPYHENPEAFGDSRKISSNYILNNRVQALNLNIHYLIFKKYRLNTVILSSKNGGHQTLPLDLKQISLGQTVRTSLPHFDIQASVSADIGQYFQNTYGVKVGLLKKW